MWDVMRNTGFLFFRKIAVLSAILAAVTFISGCDRGKPIEKIASNATYNPFENPSVYFSSMSTMIVEVAYETGAEPNTSVTTKGTSYWDILKVNLEALFENRNVQPLIIVPKALSEMTAIPAQNKSTWTLEEIYALTRSYRHGSSNSTSSNFWIVYLNGNLVENGEIKNTVIGLQINGTNVIAIFKEAIAANSPNANGPTAKYTEQATMAHELGHALGLVNHGMPMQEEHEDKNHAGHCNNPDCVMFWANEGGASLATFIQKYLITGSTVFFGDECLQDTQLYNP